MMFGSEVAERVPNMVRSMCVIWISLFLFGLLTITKYEHPATQEEHKDSLQQLKSEAENQAEVDAPIIKILQTKKFKLLYLIAASHKF
jgi:hypothetical protein